MCKYSTNVEYSLLVIVIFIICSKFCCTIELRSGSHVRSPFDLGPERADHFDLWREPCSADTLVPKVPEYILMLLIETNFQVGKRSTLHIYFVFFLYFEPSGPGICRSPPDAIASVSLYKNVILSQFP